MVINLPSSRKKEILEQVYHDVIECGGIHVLGNKQTGKSNFKKSFSQFVMEYHSETKLIIIDVEGRWQWDFSSIRYFVIPKNSISIIEQPIGVRLNGSVFTKKTYKLNSNIEKVVLKLLRDSEPVLFIVELEDTETCGYFSAFVISQIYDMQRIARKYWYGKLQKSYCVVLEESENIFDSQNLEKKLFNTLRKKYNEMANLQIGILSSSQRLTEVSKKFRGKMHGYLVGYTNPDDYIGQLGRILTKISEQPKIVLKPQFRYKFLYTPTDKIITLGIFKQQGKPYKYQKPQVKPKPLPKPKTTWQKIKDLFNREAEEEPYIGQDEEGDTDAIIEDEDLIEEDLFG